MSNFSAWARVLGLALALLLPQLLGLLHAITHDMTHDTTRDTKHLASLQRAQGLPSVLAGRHDHDHRTPSALADLFASHDEGSPDCRWYDQASHDGIAPNVAALSLPLPIPGSGVALFAGDAIARWAAQFEARGPPLTS